MESTFALSSDIRFYYTQYCLDELLSLHECLRIYFHLCLWYFELGGQKFAASPDGGEITMLCGISLFSHTFVQVSTVAALRLRKITLRSVAQYYVSLEDRDSGCLFNKAKTRAKRVNTRQGSGIM